MRRAHSRLRVFLHIVPDDLYDPSVAKVYGREYPERPLMGVLSDLLGIPHFTTSRGSTVRRDYLEAVGTALGVPDETLMGLSTKDDVTTVLVEAATRQRMDTGLLSEGGTVTNEALQAIIDGVTHNGVVGRPDMPEVEQQLMADAAALGFPIDDLKDERDRRLVEMAVREGQDHFRSALLEAYNLRCAITGFDAVETLEAAHIYPYKGPATNRVTNGLLLRSDIHRLYDRGAVSVHETNRQVLVKPHLQVTEYAFLANCKLRLPRLASNRPSTAALRSHREWAGFV